MLKISEIHGIACCNVTNVLSYIWGFLTIWLMGEFTHFFEISYNEQNSSIFDSLFFIFSSFFAYLYRMYFWRTWNVFHFRYSFYLHFRQYNITEQPFPTGMQFRRTQTCKLGYSTHFSSVCHIVYNIVLLKNWKGRGAECMKIIYKYSVVLLHDEGLSIAGK